MFIQTLIYLTHEIKQDRPLLTDPQENWSFQELWRFLQITAAKTSANTSAGNSSLLFDGVYLCIYTLCLHIDLLLFFSEQIWLVKNIKVCYLPPWNFKHQRLPPSGPTRTEEPRVFYPRAASSVFHLSTAQTQKAKASNDTICKKESLLPTEQGRREKKKKTSNQTDTFWRMIDVAASLYYSCDVRPDSQFARNRGLTLWLMQQSGVVRLSACQPPGWKTHNHSPSQSLLTQPMV